MVATAAMFLIPELAWAQAAVDRSPVVPDPSGAASAPSSSATAAATPQSGAPIETLAGPQVAPSTAAELHPNADYRIGPQDLLEIQVYAADGLNREVRVNSRGLVSLPLIGEVHVGGLTGEEAETLIAKLYGKDYLNDPQVSLFIKEYTSRRFTVEGAVRKPGVYPILGQTTLLQALAMAGDQGPLADLHDVMLFRTEKGHKTTTKFDVSRIRAGEVEDPPLDDEDVVVVKRVASRVVMKDSLFGDILNTLNPFNWVRPIP
ncbi:MAG: polysaccharide biosynthesis/export family protein [Casimicrobiaceae bacterium]